MKTTKTKKFDAVAESRRWKTAVSCETAGMTREQILTYFNKDRVLAALGLGVPAIKSTAIVREEPPATSQRSA